MALEIDERGASDVAEELAAEYDRRLGALPKLMPRRVEEILLVSTAYDSYTLAEDGLLGEMIQFEYMHLGLSNAPRVRRVSSGEQAIQAIHEQKFDLVISMLRLGDMDIFKFSEMLAEIAPELPIALLIANEFELVRLGDKRGDLTVDNIFVWKGDPKLFLAIIKVYEDRLNVEHDTQIGGVGVIILVEDSVRYRSSLLPLIYGELVEQTRAVMRDGLNRTQQLLRMRARPKILIAETYEQGIELYERYREYLFGIVADVSFLQEGKVNSRAGIEFICHVHAEYPDIPALLQSSDPSNSELAESIGVRFLHKRSRTLLEDLRSFMIENFGFGDFIFRLPDKTEVGRASDLRSIPRVLAEIPEEAIAYHAGRNHFSNWLLARSEFQLARKLRPRRVSEFKGIEGLRKYLIDAFEDALRESRRGTVEDFNRDHYDEHTHFARIGRGSLGGKARGLTFVDALLARRELDREFENVRIYVPRSVVIATGVFDEFLTLNRLRVTTLYEATDERIRQVFLGSRLPGHLQDDLRAFLRVVRDPIAIRSSSLLEDSQYHPFAGVYATHMIPNRHPDEDVRLTHLCDAIKLVYASMYMSVARKYLEATMHRIEEEKMAVILEGIVGHQHERYFYPDFAGVVRSYNFYPFGRMKPEEGVANVALGLGQIVVEGGESLRFCPSHPQVLPQMDSTDRFLQQSQRKFYAIDLSHPENGADAVEHAPIVQLELEDAERHGTLRPIGSSWSPENQTFYDGINRPGVRVVTFAHVLKADVFPLAKILQRVLEFGHNAMSAPVELEFAVNLHANPKQFAILQMRPYGAGGDYEPVDIGDDVPGEAQLISCNKSMGNGVIDGILDIIYVRPDAFDAARTPEIASHVAEMNDSLRRESRECVLIGPGRWGSSNSWLGIPVTWGQISSARIIVETSLDTFIVDPSQGSHFFHNLTSAGVAYLTVSPHTGDGFIDWDWLDACPAKSETELVRHLRLDAALEARLDGRSSRAVLLKEPRRAVPARTPRRDDGGSS